MQNHPKIFPQTCTIYPCLANIYETIHCSGIHLAFLNMVLDVCDHLLNIISSVGSHGPGAKCIRRFQALCTCSGFRFLLSVYYMHMSLYSVQSQLRSLYKSWECVRMYCIFFNSPTHMDRSDAEYQTPFVKKLNQTFVIYLSVLVSI